MAITGIGIDDAYVAIEVATDEQLSDAIISFQSEIKIREVAEEAAITQAIVQEFIDDPLCANTIGVNGMNITAVADETDGVAVVLNFPTDVLVQPMKGLALLAIQQIVRNYGGTEVVPYSKVRQGKMLALQHLAELHAGMSV